MNYNAIYRRWENLEDCKIHIKLPHSSESIQGKIISEGLYGINNHPLKDFRWQDLVISQTIQTKDQIVFRRWKTEVFFGYEPEFSLEEQCQQRRTICDALSIDSCKVSFFTPGLARGLFLEFLKEDEAKQRLEEALCPLGIKITQVGME